MSSNSNETVARLDANKNPKLATKADFDLHILLCMRQDDVNKPKAMLSAYREGLSGLNNRLSAR